MHSGHRGPALAMGFPTGGHQMFSERGIKALAAPSPMYSSSPSLHSFRTTSPVASSSLPASARASRIVVPLLLAETAAFILVAASGKIPVFLFTAIRALLTF